MRNQTISWLCLIICLVQAVAFIACQCAASNAKASHVAVMDSTSRELSADSSFHVDQPNGGSGGWRHINEKEVDAVVHKRRGGSGGSDVYKKPSKKHSGASNTAVILGRIALCVCLAFNYLFLLPRGLN